MKEKAISLVVGFLFCFQAAVGGLNYNILSYAEISEVKVGNMIVANPYAFSQDTPPFEQRGSVSAMVDANGDWFECTASAYWSEPEYGRDYFIPLGEVVDARSSITMTFQPYGNQVEIHGMGGIYMSPLGAAFYYRLADLTNGQTILNPEGIYSLNPNHIYELHVYAGTTLMGPDEIYNGAEVQVAFFVTPEPATFSLLALGAMLAAGRKRG